MNQLAMGGFQGEMILCVLSEIALCDCTDVVGSWFRSLHERCHRVSNRKQGVVFMLKGYED